MALREGWGFRWAGGRGGAKRSALSKFAAGGAEGGPGGLGGAKSIGGAEGGRWH